MFPSWGENKSVLGKRRDQDYEGAGEKEEMGETDKGEKESLSN